LVFRQGLATLVRIRSAFRYFWPTHRRDFLDSVTITRECHPFEGRALAVIGSICRRGTPFVLACLPDGTRALIPAPVVSPASLARDPEWGCNPRPL
jgi:hypothetical protein